MREIYICVCCGFVSTKLSEFKMVGLDEMGNPVYACKQCPPFAEGTEQLLQLDIKDKHANNDNMSRLREKDKD